METKDKIVALRELAVVLCLMLFVALPATTIAAAAEEDEYVLGIYGNANEDDTIDMRDLTYVKLIFFGKKSETELADAKYDGKINPLDFIQIKLIIVGKEKELTVVDSADRTVTVKKPVERIVPMVTWSYEPIWILEAQDKVVGVTTDAQDVAYTWLPGIMDKPTVGTYKELDYEEVIEGNPQTVIVLDRYVNEVEEKLSPLGITVVALNLRRQEKFDPEFKILAKIVGEDEKANSFITWKNGYVDWIKEETEGIEPKEQVYANWCDYPWLTVSEGAGLHDVITMAGGYNIAGNLPGPYPFVDSEWVLRENPEVIITAASGCSIPYTGYTMDSYENAKRLIEETCNITGLKETDAVDKGRVYVIDGFCVEAVRGFIGVFYCARWFYPEQFDDLEPEEIHREYIEEWLGVPYKGTWVYPPVS